MTFKYNKRRIIEEVIVRSLTITFLGYLGYNFNLINLEKNPNYSFSIIWIIALSLHIYTVLKIINKRWKKAAVSISNKTIEILEINELIPWKNINDLTYKIDLRDSFLIIELNSKTFKKKKNKLLNYYSLFKVGFQSGPIKINLDELEGEPRKIFDIILDYKKAL